MRWSKRVAGLETVVLALGLLSAGCPPTNTVVDAPKLDDEEQATCKVAKDPLNPLIVEWPGTNKVALDAASKKGAVVVSYVGCTLKVLDRCQATGTYDLARVTPVREKLTIETESDLYARLPLAVTTLKGELSASSRLDLSYVAVGNRELAKAPASMSGDCAGATHYVRSIMVGAYALDAVAKGQGSLAVGVGDKEAGASRSEGVRKLPPAAAAGR